MSRRLSITCSREETPLVNGLLHAEIRLIYPKLNMYTLKLYHRRRLILYKGISQTSILSDIVMDDLEIDCITKLNFKPTFHFRYVDDVVLCIQKNSVDHTLNIFNSYDKNLQFTVVVAQNNSINFFDIKILINNHRQLITNWYQKPIFQDVT